MSETEKEHSKRIEALKKFYRKRYSMNYSQTSKTTQIGIDGIITAISLILGNLVSVPLNIPAEQQPVIVAAISTAIGIGLHALKQLFNKPKLSV